MRATRAARSTSSRVDCGIAAIGAPVNGATIVDEVEDVDAVFTHGLQLGATAALPVDEVPGVGRLGYLMDPDHNVFGLITPKTPE